MFPGGRFGCSENEDFHQAITEEWGSILFVESLHE